LIVVVDRAWKGEISNRLDRVGRYHASRTILCAVEEGRDTLDARAGIDYDESAAGDLSVMHERVEIDLGPGQLSALDTVVDPVIVAELQTMLWCPHGHREAIAALRGKVDVILLDSDDEVDASQGLADAAELLDSSYVVDLAWLRTTPWRERLASMFDHPDRRPLLREIDELSVRHRATSKASALLLAGWLASRLDWQPEPLASANGSGLRGAAQHGATGIDIELAPRDQDAPGLAGVTVASRTDFSLSLDRAQGGLCACVDQGGAKRQWQILGASRGEGGILGEGVRQALLRDPTYGPALAAAQGFCK
jgi:glucose-6-phosphate dehydrogenase assembly protein OpcA